MDKKLEGNASPSKLTFFKKQSYFKYLKSRPFLSSIKKSNKKSQVEEQFNWLFTIVAGGVILLFFLFVLLQIKSASDAKLAAEVLNNFDGIITGTMASPNTVSIIESSKILNFELTCLSDGTSELSVPNSKSKLDTSKKLIYTPGNINGELIYSYVKPIYAPFYVGNAILLADSETFFIVYDRGKNDSFLSEIYAGLPENVSKTRAITLNQDRFRNYNKLVIISSREYLGALDEFELEFLKSKKLTYNLVAISKQAVNGGTQILIEFKTWDKGSPKQYDNSVSIPTTNLNDFIQFLIFSQNLDYYQCNYAKITKKTQMLSQIFEKRTEFLDAAVVNTDCKTRYAVAKKIFSDMKQSPDPLTSVFPSQLIDLNKGLLLSSCPLLY